MVSLILKDTIRERVKQWGKTREEDKSLDTLNSGEKMRVTGREVTLGNEVIG